MRSWVTSLVDVWEHSSVVTMVQTKAEKMVDQLANLLVVESVVTLVEKKGGK